MVKILLVSGVGVKEKGVEGSLCEEGIIMWSESDGDNERGVEVMLGDTESPLQENAETPQCPAKSEDGKGVGFEVKSERKGFGW